MVKNLFSLLLGSIFFIFLLSIMIVESVWIMIKENFKLSHPYNFRESDLARLDVMGRTEGNAIFFDLGRLPGWVGETKLYTIPDDIALKAKEILVDVRLQNSSPVDSFEVELELCGGSSTQPKEYIYLFSNAFPKQEQPSYNSELVWYPVPENKKLALKVTGITSEKNNKEISGVFHLIEWRK